MTTTPSSPTLPAPAAAHDAHDAPPVLGACLAVFFRDLRVAGRRRTDALAALAFFVMVGSLFPLGVGPQPETLRPLAAGTVWIAALLASLLATARLFHDDQIDGTLEQLLLSPHPLALMVAAKVMAHWATSGALITLAGPLIAALYGLPSEANTVLFASLLLGTPVLCLLGAVAAALTVGLRGAALLLSLLVLPLCVPLLVFGAGAVDAVLAGQSAEAHLSLLGAALLGAVALGPGACAMALRISLEA